MRTPHTLPETGRKRIKRSRYEDGLLLCNVVSLRVSDQEKWMLDRVSKCCNKNVSEVIREAIVYWIATRKRHCLDA